ncbi:MAG TPA: HAMP domain-containing histidine kinase [Propionibacterium sp.]|nr:HAMP domain-containing histidine kinase [Propionibacterium sp.]
MSVRLLLGHVAVGLLGALVMYVVVRLLAPEIFDADLRREARARIGLGPGPGIAEDFAKSVDQALIVGAVFGGLVAAALGAFVAWRVNRSLDRVREGTRRIAAGDYSADVAEPVETELAEVVRDVNTLGAALAETEGRRLRLLGEVAHEMRTPITIIHGYVEGMIDGVLPPDREHLSQVVVEACRLRRLSDDLSSLSRAEEGRLRFTPRRLDLRQVVGEAAERLRQQAQEGGVGFGVDLGASALVVDADADRIAQVVTNLVGNAIAATPPGGSIRLAAHAEGTTAAVDVADDGEGIAPEHVGHVFERFYRVPGRRTAGEATGSGIGLTIARTIAERHGGSLTVGSAGLGHGATFTLRVPLAGSGPSPEGGPDVVEHPPAAPAP